MKKCALVSILFILIILNSCDDAFENTTYVVTIPQDIGGNLVCDVQYISDFHSFDYYISYTYVNNNDTIPIGSGNYHGESWEKDEQLIHIGEWYALKTSNCWDSDKLITGKLDTTEKWKEYIFSVDSIENSEIWRRGNINSNPHNGGSEVAVQSIDSKGNILVEYDYAIKDRMFAFITGDRELIYRIDKKTGLPYLVKIVEE